MDARYADLEIKPEPVAYRRTPARTQTPSAARPVHRQHTPLTEAGCDRAAVARATSRLAHADGRDTKKPITFNAAL